MSDVNVTEKVARAVDRWRVRRARQSWGKWWDVTCPVPFERCMCARFGTWREAVDYVDEMTRRRP